MKNLILLLGILLLTGCATVRVAVDFDATTDFKAYKTYQFVKPQRRQQGRGAGRNAVQNPLFTQEVMNEIKPLMESKGFVQARNQREADLLIVFYAAIQNQRDFISPTYRVGRWGRAWKTSPGRFVNTKEGTLVIDMVDNEAKALVWQGVGTGVLDRVNPQVNLVESVEEILDRFPPVEE